MRNKPMNEDQIAQAHALYEELGNFNEVGRRMGYSGSAIQKQLIKVGLHTPARQKRDYQLHDLQRWAQDNDARGEGKCLSHEYTKLNDIYSWKCSNPEHEAFFATANSVRQGSWCRECFNESRSGKFTKYTAKDCHQLAENNKGKFLSDKYSTGKLKWECEFGHQFYETRNNIKNLHRWCPVCSQYKNQEYTRFIFAHIFQTSFPRTTLGKLGLISGSRIEIDGYNDDLKMGFEYNGAWHTSDPSHRFYSAERIRIDEIKKEVCRKNGITLVIVPGYPTEYSDRWSLVEKTLQKHNVPWPGYTVPDELPTSFRSRYHHEIQDIIEEKGGELLTKVIMFAHQKIEFRCEQGHLVNTLTANKVKRGQWCKHRIPNRQLTDADREKRAANVESVYLGQYKVGKETWFNMKCNEGHMYTRRLSRIQQGYGCNHPEHKGQKRFKAYTSRHDDFSE